LVETGTKTASCSGQDDGSNFGILLSFVQGLMELLEHASGDRIERFGAIQCDKDTAALFLVENLFIVRHGLLLE
jgi:hypothetical protein